MSELVHWLRQQLDADEQTIDDYERHRAGEPCLNFDGQDPADYDQYDTCSRHIATSEAMPYHTPEFGRRDIEAKRRIVDICETEDRHVMQSGADWAAFLTPEDVLALLALPYADRPGYRQEWAP